MNVGIAGRADLFSSVFVGVSQSTRGARAHDDVVVEAKLDEYPYPRSHLAIRVRRCNYPDVLHDSPGPLPVEWCTLLSCEAYRPHGARAEHEVGLAVEADRRSRRRAEQVDALAGEDVGRVVLALDAYSEISEPPRAQPTALD